MAKSDLVHSIRNGSYETELLDLRLTDGTGKAFVGQGRLEWTDADGTLVEAYTDGGPAGVEEFVRRFFERTLEPGKLMRAEHYLKLEAQTQTGTTVTIERLDPDSCRAHSRSSTLIWRWTDRTIASHVVIRQETRVAFVPAAELLVMPVTFRVWPRPTKTDCDNPRFPDGGGTLDWLETQTSVGTVAAQMGAGETVRIKVLEAKGEYPSLLKPVLLGFGFLCGHPISCLASEYFSGTEHIGRLGWRSEARGNRFPRPVDAVELRHQLEPCLGKAIEFFATPLGDRFAQLLEPCWDTVDSLESTRILTTCTALEGMVKKLTRKPLSHEVASKAQKKMIGRMMADAKLSSRVIHRVQSSFGRLSQINVRSILSDWHGRGLLGIEKEDIDAFGMLRHPAAHGATIGDADNDDALQQRLDALHRIRNMINKLTLQAMGYTGRYMDYTAWKPAEFPAADPGAL